MSNTPHAENIKAQLDRLVSPQAMGGLFKVIELFTPAWKTRCQAAVSPDKSAL
jgi:SAM-dependent MidA family methyltransferase